MTNIVVSILIVTNSHWTVMEVKPSNLNCCVIGCQEDHSEMRIESETVQRIWVALVPFEGATHRVTLKTEFVVPANEIGKRRTVYSGFDYKKEKKPVSWAIPSPFDQLTNSFGKLLMP